MRIDYSQIIAFIDRTELIRFDLIRFEIEVWAYANDMVTKYMKRKMKDTNANGGVK